MTTFANINDKLGREILATLRFSTLSASRIFLPRNKGPRNDGARNASACRMLAPWDEGGQAIAVVVRQCYQLPALSPSTARDFGCMGATLVGPIMWMFPQEEHLELALSIFLWFVRLAGCLNSLPHSSHKYSLRHLLLACEEHKVSGHLCCEEPA